MFPPVSKLKEGSISTEPHKIERKPDNEEQELDFMEACAEDLIHAIHSKDPKAVAEALHAAFQIAESYPHEEAE